MKREKKLKGKDHKVFVDFVNVCITFPVHEVAKSCLEHTFVSSDSFKL